MADPISDSIYTPLDPSQNVIRLLEIVSTNPEIVCTLSLVSLKDNPRFCALSYEWGDPAIRTTITVEDKPVAITRNLACALQDVHYHWNQSSLPEEENGARRLWADAICINQDDTDEKNHQVPLMTKIYSSAESTFSWLGRFNGVSETGFNAFKLVHQEVSRLDDIHQGTIEWLKKYTPDGRRFIYPSLSSAQDESCTILKYRRVEYIKRHFEGMTHLLNLTYWRRVWIFQEIVLSRNALFICGPEHISFSALYSGCSWFRALEKNGTEHKPSFLHHDAWIQLLELDMTLLQRIGDAKLMSRITTRPGGVTFASHFLLAFRDLDQQASNPKDLVYGFSGITSVCNTPDYSNNKSVAEVYCEVVRQWHLASEDGYKRASGTTDHLCEVLWYLCNAGVGYHWAPVPGLPSWAPNLSGVSTSDSPQRIMFDVPGCDADFYGFDKSVMPRLKDSRLHCSGIAAGSLRWIGPVIPNVWEDAKFGQILDWAKECVSRSVTYMPMECHTLVPIFQTLFLQPKRRPDVIITEEIWPLICVLLPLIMPARASDREWEESCLDTLLSTFPLEQLEKDDSVRKRTSQLLKEGLSDWELISEGINFLGKISTRRGLRMAQTENGYIGIFPPLVEQDDIIWVLNGSAVPVVLRKVGEYYVHVGTCFVPGLMQGEAADLIKTGKASIEEIEIR